MQSPRKSLWDAVIEAVSDSDPGRPVVPLDEQLLRVIHHHTEAEEGSLADYKTLRDETPDPVVRLLLTELIADEEHHHSLLYRLEAQLASDLGVSGRPGTMSAGSAPTHSATADQVEAVKGLAEHEQRGADHLHDVAKENQTTHAGVFSILLEMMSMDSRKHQAMLAFIAKRMEGAT